MRVKKDMRHLFVALSFILLVSFCKSQTVSSITLSQDAISGTGVIQCSVVVPYHANSATLKMTSSSSLVTISPHSVQLPPGSQNLGFTLTVSVTSTPQAVYIIAASDSNPQGTHLFCYSSIWVLFWWRILAV